VTLAEAEGPEVRVAETHPEPGDFPGLPVRDEHVAVRMIRYRDEGSRRRVRARLELRDDDEQAPLTRRRARRSADRVGRLWGGARDYRGAMEQRVLQIFLAADGRLTTIPTKHAKLMVVLDHLAQSFEPGETYPEARVNEILQRFHPDYAALRRYLVENGFMTREDNVYWRSGGTFEV
jgi:hypothetical protein